ncbi:MAG: acyl-CoA dehydrogenase family protein [Gammaproteobacteria bacterium]
MNATARAAAFIERAHALAPVFAARARDTERARAPLDESVQDLIEAGFLSILTPRCYGGEELPIDTMSRVVAVLSAACPSTGWISAFYMGAAWRALCFPVAAQRELFADKPYVLNAGQAAPLREALRVAGGYLLSGQTPWSSGVVHAEWITFMGVATGGDLPPEPMMFIVPRAQTELVDTWHVAGMRGTGSHDVRCERVFVPDRRAASFVAALEGRTPGQAAHENRMYRQPFLPFLMCEVVPVLVGALRGAAAAFVERVKTRRGTISGVQASSQQAAQMRLARGLAAADAAETLLDDYLQRYMRSRPTQYELLDRADMKMRASYLTDLCRNAVNDLARGFGADGFREESPLQRYFRDVNMLAVHAFLDIDTAAATYGRLLLDLPVEDTLL